MVRLIPRVTYQAAKQVARVGDRGLFQYCWFFLLFIIQAELKGGFLCLLLSLKNVGEDESALKWRSICHIALVYQIFKFINNINLAKVDL